MSGVGNLFTKQWSLEDLAEPEKGDLGPREILRCKISVRIFRIEAFKLVFARLVNKQRVMVIQADSFFPTWELSSQWEKPSRHKDYGLQLQLSVSLQLRLITLPYRLRGLDCMAMPTTHEITF